MSSMPALLKFQIGPVQDFIAQARSTRDLWSGSYLLSWLAAAGIRELRKKGGELIFPDPEGQPLLALPDLPDNGDHGDLLTPNLPNIFIARIDGDARQVAEDVKSAIVGEWQAIARAVWEKKGLIGLPEATHARFQAQVDRHLSISWQVTPLADGTAETYANAYRRNGWHLDAVRQTREFRAWDPANGMGEKDSLSGKEEALIGGVDFKAGMERKDGEYPSLFAKHADYLGAVAAIKRCWHLAYLREVHGGLKTRSREFTIRSIPAIAARKITHDDDDSSAETGGGEKYIAAIAFDGDSIGAWVSGDKSAKGIDLKEHHRNFSRALSDFAMKRVRDIVEKQFDGRDRDGRSVKVPLGQLIYAGGDDVVALVPADKALDVVADLRNAFREATTAIKGRDGNSPDASAGIAIGHIHSPLQDLIREAQRAEKRAKNAVGRPAFSVTLIKRSGEISHWGSRWESRGLELYQKIEALLGDGRLSAKFPHRVCQLLEPYLTSRSGLSTQTDAVREAESVKDLIGREFAFAAERQGSPAAAAELGGLLSAYLNGVLNARADRRKLGKGQEGSATQELLDSVISLCTAVAFANRNREPKSGQSPAVQQPSLA